MATIFGEVQPSRSQGQAQDEQYSAILKEEMEQFKAEVSASRHGSANDRQHGPAEARERMQARIQQRMQVETPQEQMARFETKFRERVNTSPQLKNLDPTDPLYREKSMSLAAKTAQEMNMPDIAHQLAGQHTKLVTDRIKGDIEIEKLNADVAYTESQTRKADADGRKLVKGTDANGNETEQMVDRDGNPIGEERITKYAIPTSRLVGEGKYALFDGKGQEIETEAGTKLEFEQEEERYKRLAGQLASTDQLLSNVEKALGNVGGGVLGGIFTAGMGGQAMAMLPSFPIVGNDARLLNSQVLAIKAALSSTQLAKMREESKSGGAVGNVSDRDLTMLESTVQNLDTTLSPEEIVTSLRDIATYYKNFKEMSMRQVGVEERLTRDWNDPVFDPYRVVIDGVEAVRMSPKAVWLKE